MCRSVAFYNRVQHNSQRQTTETGWKNKIVVIDDWYNLSISFRFALVHAHSQQTHTFANSLPNPLPLYISGTSVWSISMMFSSAHFVYEMNAFDVPSFMKNIFSTGSCCILGQWCDFDRSIYLPLSLGSSFSLIILMQTGVSASVLILCTSVLFSLSLFCFFKIQQLYSVCTWYLIFSDK